MGKPNSTIMKRHLTTLMLTIPTGVELTVTSRHFKVKGPKGDLHRDFRHLLVDTQLLKSNSENLLKINGHFTSKKHLAAMHTLRSHLANMITGVTKGFVYKMRLVYAHYPINLTVLDNGKQVDIRNFLGEKVVRSIKMLDGVSCKASTSV